MSEKGILGVDDGVLIIHSFNKLTRKVNRQSAVLSRVDKLSIVMRDVGPSIAVTSLTNSLAFLSGQLNTPAVTQQLYYKYNTFRSVFQSL